MSSHILSPDTQAILLLCASFGQNRQAEPQPLTVKEYGSLVKWLLERNLTPASLLELSLLESTWLESTWLENGLENSVQERRLKSQLQNISIGQLNPDRLVALLERGAMLALAIENWTNKGIWVLARSDRHYPKRLKKQLQNAAPPILYGVGNIDLLSKGGLAVLGSRDVDDEAIAYTEQVAQTSAEEGIQIVSGGARGVDRSAMLAAVQAGGTAVGILADSLTKASVYGKYRSGIRDGQLTLVSAYDPDAGFTVGNAMGRNKYVYALADYALVVSSSLEKGGTWAGATEALRRLKDVPVFVRVQGNLPPGNRALLNLRAKPFPNLSENASLPELLQAASAEDAMPLTTDSLRDKEVLDKEVLDKVAREIPVPQSNIPEIPVPQSEIPEISLPQSEIPEISLPQSNIPEIPLPQSNIPEIPLSQSNIPEIPGLESDIQDNDFGDKQILDRGDREISVQDNDIQDNDIQEKDAKAASAVAASRQTNKDSETEKVKASGTNLEAIAPHPSIYQRVLPLILRKLEQPQAIKPLAKSLEVRERQLQDWLDIALEEGKISKTKRPVMYVANRQEPKNIYEAALPWIVAALEQPQAIEPLAQELDLLEGQMATWLNRAVAEGKVAATNGLQEYVVTPQLKNIYEAALPLILAALEQPQAIDTLAQELNLQKSQLKDWLSRAVDEDKISKTKRPVRYVANPPETQLSLLPPS